MEKNFTLDGAYSSLPPLMPKLTKSCSVRHFIQTLINVFFGPYFSQTSPFTHIHAFTLPFQAPVNHLWVGLPQESSARRGDEQAQPGEEGPVRAALHLWPGQLDWGTARSRGFSFYLSKPLGLALAIKVRSSSHQVEREKGHLLFFILLNQLGKKRRKR